MIFRYEKEIEKSRELAMIIERAVERLRMLLSCVIQQKHNTRVIFHRNPQSHLSPAMSSNDDSDTIRGYFNQHKICISLTDPQQRRHQTWQHCEKIIFASNKKCAELHGKSTSSQRRRLHVIFVFELLLFIIEMRGINFYIW